MNTLPRAAARACAIALHALLALPLAGLLPASAQAAPAASTASDPEASTRALLQRHRAGQGDFSTATLQALAPWLAPELQQSAHAWLARPASPDEVPDINGDPFTDSQEPPRSIQVGRAVLRGGQARVPVTLRFAGGPARTLHYLWQRTSDRWLLQDIDFGHGPSLRRLLGA